MKEKVYLVLQRHIIRQSKKRVVWSEWYTYSLDACYLSIDEALKHVMLLRNAAEKQSIDFVDYRVQVLLVH